ncbi:hypothetical protein RLEG3_02715 (plasmid) [Rhizobium leguminosarum bv. trifolii WSM1689]|nr:hypothetical protein RLEG3_02715 [Rhizobium leguminosarum bv. trifolii WSM1689]
MNRRNHMQTDKAGIDRPAIKVGLLVAERDPDLLRMALNSAGREYDKSQMGLLVPKLVPV